MKLKQFIFSVFAFVLLMISFSFAYNVNNYFTNPGSGKENTLVISGTQTVSGYLNVTGTQTISGTMSVADLTATGLITASSCTVTNTITGGTITDGTATLTSGAITGLLDFTSSSGTVTNQITAGTIDTGQGATEVYAMDQDVQTTDAVTFSSGTVTNSFRANSLAPSGSYTGAELQALTPNWIGEMVINESVTPNEIYVSTGTSAGQWTAIKDYTTEP